MKSLAWDGRARSRKRLITLVCLCTSTTILWLLVTPGLAEGPRTTASEQAVYDPEPQHLWNRLYEAMAVHPGPDGGMYGRDRIEPLLWPGSKQLLQNATHDRAVQLLNEFLDKQGERLID